MTDQPDRKDRTDIDVDNGGRSLSDLPPPSAEDLYAKIRDQEVLIRELRMSLSEAIDSARSEGTALCIEKAPLAFLSVDTNWRVLEANEEAERLSGKRRESLLDTDLWSLLGRMGAPGDLYQTFATALGKNLPADLEIFSGILGKWLHVHLTPSPDGLWLWFRDLTREKNQIAAQARLWKQFKSLTENAPIIIMRFEATLACSFANLAARQIMGFELKAPLGRRLADMNPGDAGASMEEAVKRVFAEGEAVSGETRIRMGEEKRYLSFRAVPEPGFQGVATVLLVAQDVTELKTLEAQLRESQKMEALGTLTGGIAHDFNNILFAIIGFTELMAGRIAKGSRDERYLRRVMDASLRGRELVRQMLTFARKNEGEQKKPVRLSAVVEETVELLRASTPATIDIKTRTRESGPILSDVSQIQQVIMNLAANAVFAMKEKGGTLNIEVEDFVAPESNGNPHSMEAGPYVKLLVRDSGVGIAPEVIERIFDPFFTTKGVGEGTGLGLSVVHGIVRQSNGYIFVESEPGAGSVFTVYFPRISGEEESGDLVGEGLRAGTERILFVDDEEALTEMGAEMLGQLGYRVTTGIGAREALSLVKEDPLRFDLVVTDQTMPEMTGLDLAREILSMRRDMPIILCTGYSALVNERKARSAGVGAFLMKPYTRKELSDAVGRVLRAHKEKGGHHG